MNKEICQGSEKHNKRGNITSTEGKQSKKQADIDLEA